MEALQQFQSNEFGNLGILIVDGKEYFPATACAKMLGYAEPQKAIRVHCKGVSKMDTPTAGGHQEVNFIPEGDLYRLIIRSKLPTAERFERWVFEEVLPSIRQHGTYGSALDASAITQIVTETVRQLMPYLAATPARTPRVPSPAGMRRHGAAHSGVGIIEQINPELIEKVDEMLEQPEMYTYVDIASVLQSYGVQISGTSVQRYHFRLMARRGFSK